MKILIGYYVNKNQNCYENNYFWRDLLKMVIEIHMDLRHTKKIL